MANFIRTIQCVIGLCSVISSVGIAQSKPGIKVIEPEKKVPKATAAAIDDEHFEVGAYFGMLSVEDFNTNPVVGLAARYYWDASLFFELAHGKSSTKRAHPEESQDFNPERDFSYTSIAAGYRLLEGRSFIGKRNKFNSGLYVVAGASNVDFAEESNTGMVLGLSYKTVLTDWMTINVDFKNHLVDRSFLGDDKLTNNGEFSFGINTIF